MRELNGAEMEQVAGGFLISKLIHKVVAIKTATFHKPAPTPTPAPCCPPKPPVYC